MKRRSRAGFTIIEVMISLGIMVLGALAVIGLQQHTIRANAQARQFSTAMQIAQMWIERMKQDAARWTQVGFAAGTPSLGDVLGPTTYLQRVLVTPDEFQTIPIAAATATLSNAFDFQGQGVDPGTSPPGTIYFCASFRPSWVYVGRSLRVDVRVWWARDNREAILDDDTAACADDNVGLNPGGEFFDDYHVVYLSTVLRHNQL